MAFAEEPAPRTNVAAAALPDAVSLPPGFLDNVRDLTRGIQNEERDLYYEVLAHARDSDFAAQKVAGRQAVAQAEQRFRQTQKPGQKYSLFVDMVKHPEQFRGQPVTLRGYIHDLKSYDAGENDVGLKRLYEAYLYTADSNGNPYVIVSTEVPPNLPQPKRGSPTNDVVVTGYLFKIWLYEAEKGNWGAPLILAQRLEWKPPPPAKSLSTAARVGIAGAIAATILVLVIVAQRNNRHAREQRAKWVSAAEGPLPSTLNMPLPQEMPSPDAPLGKS